MDPFFAVLLMLISFMLAARGWMVGQRWSVVFLAVPAFYLFIAHNFWASSGCLLVLLAGWWYLKRFEPEQKPPQSG